MAAVSGDRPVALVTGASSGFGLHTSVALAREGYRVVAAMRSLQGRDGLEREAEQAGVLASIDSMQLDVTDHAAIEATVREIVGRYGTIDVLVNNAGIAVGGFVEEVPMEDWVRQMETNFFGTVAMTKAVLPVMRTQGRGTIVNISSVSGRTSFPGYAPYASSKFAVEGFTEALRLEMKPFGIHAVLFEPGAYKTAIWRKGFESIRARDDSPYREATEAVLRFSRHAAETAPHPREVAEAIARIVRSPSPKLRYMKGKGAFFAVLFKSILPWKWYEKLILFGLRR